MKNLYYQVQWLQNQFPRTLYQSQNLLCSIFETHVFVWNAQFNQSELSNRLEFIPSCHQGNISGTGFSLRCATRTMLEPMDCTDYSSMPHDFWQLILHGLPHVFSRRDYGWTQQHDSIPIVHQKHYDQWILPKWSVCNYFMRDSICLCAKFSWKFVLLKVPEYAAAMSLSMVRSLGEAFWSPFWSPDRSVVWWGTQTDTSSCPSANLSLKPFSSWGLVLVVVVVVAVVVSNILDSKLLQAMLTDLLAGFSSKSVCLSERSEF